MAGAIVPSDIYPAVRRFLLESGLQRALKAFDKETATEDAASVGKSKKAKVLAELELTAACQLWLGDHLSAAAGAGEPQPEGGEAKRRKRKAAEEAEAEEPAAPAAEERPKKKRRSEEGLGEKANPADPEPGAKNGGAPEPAAAEGAEPAIEENGDAAPKNGRKEKKKEKAAEKKPGVPFKRIDEEKWAKVIKDERLLDNTHKAKEKFGGSQGDSWADKASEDLLKVKGKGFRKEMAKKKRASWRGGGEIDQGVNSIKFEDSDEEGEE